MNETFDATRLTLLLTELRLPATKQMWSAFAAQSDKEGWPAARLLTVLAENELVRISASGTGGASSGTWLRPNCCLARRWTTSTSTPCRWSPRHR